ncbi:MAG: nicotinate-nucleotide adenylyltransferase [Chloroflexi bacterium]|nr:nicotinate-nucleotide adenylyltransferase [Chloroflexota bacterium]
MRIGILGGTFDPVHLAHLIIAEEARERLDLEQVLFIPVGDPWLREEKPATPPRQRLAIVELAVRSNPYFHASDIEVCRPGPTYTVDTLEALHREWGPGAEAFFILGLDTLLELPRWRKPERLVELCTLVAFLRPGYPVERVEAVQAALPGLRDRLRLLEGPLIGISGTEVRRRVALGRSIRYLVPEPVEEFIREEGLYIL